MTKEQKLPHQDYQGFQARIQRADINKLIPNFATECNEARQKLRKEKNRNKRSQSMHDYDPEFELTTSERILLWLSAAFATSFFTWLAFKLFQLFWS